jgi:hypothetical protein
MDTLIAEKNQNQKQNKLILGHRANQSAVVLALPQPGGADILKAKLELRKKR